MRPLISPRDLAMIQHFAIQTVGTFGQQVYWLQRIGPDTPGAERSPAWDGTRALQAAFSDGSYGVGWQAIQGGVPRGGYLAPIQVLVGIRDNVTTAIQTEAGIVLYSGTVLLYLPDLPIAKGDVLVKVDAEGERYVVGDNLPIDQVFGTPVLNYADLETRDFGDPIYSLPLA